MTSFLGFFKYFVKINFGKSSVLFIRLNRSHNNNVTNIKSNW